MRILSDLKPKKVFYYFEEICGIPHGSGNCQAISEFLTAFAQERNLFFDVDAHRNVLIRKPASPGYEKFETIILQGHMDMVCEKEADIDFDFEKDPIRPYIDGDLIRARGTTLGGDNGIAVAMMLALLDDDNLQHPQIEALFTVDEETSMEGAFGFDCKKLQGHRLINLDSEEEGVLMCSCAGGVDAEGSLPVAREQYNGVKVGLSIEGLIGGHSGVEIHKGRANANVLMGRLLRQLQQEFPLHILSYYGGNRVNAIARNARVQLIVEEGQYSLLAEKIKETEALFREEYHFADPSITIRVEKAETGSFSVLNQASAGRLIGLLIALPDGMQEMSQEMAGLVQTSCNLGAAELQEEVFTFTSSIRSSVNSRKAALADKICEIGKLSGGKVQLSGGYPGWAYNPDSKLIQTILDAYQQVCGIEASVEAVHAGMECGIFAASIGNLDCVSIGPTMGEVHTPAEHLSISSTERTYRVLVHILENARYPMN